MSLDVYLMTEVAQLKAASSGIFIREDGQTKEISREEWNERFPEVEPVMLNERLYETRVLFDRNMTHNLGRMATEAGIYQHLWRPDELGITKAIDLIAPLALGLSKLKSDPETYKKFNPENGWGNYEGLVSFVSAYLKACQTYPDANVEVSR